MDLPEQIAAARTRAGLSAAETARKAGITARTLANIEAGSPARPETIAALCRALDVPYAQPVPDDADTATRVRITRLNLGYTQDRLAEAAGVAAKTVQNVEAGERPSPATVAALEHALGVALLEHAGDSGRSLPDLIASYMSAANLPSSRALAKKAGMSPQTVSSMRRGHTSPDEPTLRKVAAALATDETPSTVVFRELYAAAHGRQLVPYVPPAEADELTAANRELVNRVIRLAVAAQRTEEPVGMRGDDSGPDAETSGPYTATS